MSETANFGFPKRPTGDLIMAKDINDILDAIDSTLSTALKREAMQVDDGALAVPETAGWNAFAPTLRTGFIFASEIEITKVRVVGTNNTWTDPDIRFSLALAGGVVPLFLGCDLPAGAPFDVVFELPAPVTVLETDVLVPLIDGGAGGAGTCDLQFAIEVDKVVPEE